MLSLRKTLICGHQLRYPGQEQQQQRAEEAEAQRKILRGLQAAPYECSKTPVGATSLPLEDGGIYSSTADSVGT